MAKLANFPKQTLSLRKWDVEIISLIIDFEVLMFYWCWNYQLGDHWMYEWGLNLEFKSCLWATVRSYSVLMDLPTQCFACSWFAVQHWIHKMSKRIKREWKCIIFHLMAHNHNLCQRISAYQIQSCLFTYQSAELIRA